MEPPPLPSEPVTITSPPPKPIGEGVGGPAHRIVVQQLVQEAAAMGFWTDREFTLSGSGRVDLVIGNSRRKIAVEVAMTGNTAHEIENLTKCLAADFTAVVCVSPHPGIVANIRAAAQRQQMPEFARLHFLSPDELITQLKPFAIENMDDTSGPDVKVIGGRRIAVRRMEHSEAQRKAEEEGFRTVAEFISQKPPRGES
jgi:hypothetical protein